MQNKHKRLILLHGTGRYNPLRTKYKYSKHRDIYRDLVGHFEKYLTSENVFKIFNNQWRCDDSQFIGWFADQLSQSNICVRNVLFPSPYQIITFIVRPYIKSSRIIVRHAILFFIASYYTHRKPIFRLYIYIYRYNLYISTIMLVHDDVIKRKLYPCYWSLHVVLVCMPEWASLTPPVCTAITLCQQQ